MSLYEAPREKGEHKGVVISVLGFGAPKADSACRNAASSSSVAGITNAPIAVRLGYDFYEVDWCNPYDFLQRNGFVLKEMIEDIRPTLTGNQKFFISGISMGGLISRYILTRLESEGFDHGVDLWMTNDSPLEGAYVPLSVMFLADFVSNNDLFSGLFQDGNLEQLLGAAYADSARQMVLAHHQSAQPGAPHPDHIEFFRELESLGSFPKAPGRTVAIASGAGTLQASHSIGGLTWQLPVEKPLLDLPLPVLWWTVTIRVDFKGTLTLRLLPLTQPRQEVLRVELEGDFLLNGNPLEQLDLDNLTVDSILAETKRILRIPSVLSAPADLVLRPIAQAILDNFGLLGLARSAQPVDAQFGYEGMAGGLYEGYSDVFKALDPLAGEVRGGLRNTFIPTYSALALKQPPDSDLTDLSQVSSPFSEIVLQSRDRQHTVSETDVLCRELRRLAGVAYITAVEPPLRVAGRGAFTLTVRGGNFTPQTVISWEGQKRTTTFVNSGVVTTAISNDDIAEPSNEALSPELWDVRRPKIVAVDNLDAAGNVAAGDFYADRAGCMIGVGVQGNPVTINPANPRAKERIKAVLVGEWNDACIPRDPEVSVSDNQVTVKTATNRNEFCAQVLVPFSLPVHIGPLAVGKYEVAFLHDRPGFPFGEPPVVTVELGRRAFTVTRAQPTISLLRPANVVAGGPDFTLVVEGADFVEGVSTVLLNGVEQPTAFVNSGELQARISASAIAVAGSAAISVESGDDEFAPAPARANEMDPAPATLTIEEAPPSITSLSPDSAAEGSGTLALSVRGMNFVPEAVVLWTNHEGTTAAIATRYLSSTTLEATVPAGLLAMPGSYRVTVSSSGLTSAGVFFAVERPEATGRTPMFVAAGLVDAASYEVGIVPGGLATLFGIGLSEVEGAVFPEGATSFAGTTVRIGGFAAPLLLIQGPPGNEQINLQVPFELSTAQPTSIEVENNGARTSVGGVLVVAAKPGIFEIFLPGGATLAAVTHAVSGQLVTQQNPAQRDEPLSLFFTGGGPLQPAVNTGELGPVPPAVMTEPAVVRVDGRETNLLFSGYVPGFVGLYQINFIVSGNTACGMRPLDIRVGASQSDTSSLWVACP